MNCTLGFGTNRRVERITWWVTLAPAESPRGGYRHPSAPVLDGATHITLRREGALDRLGKRLSLNREWATRDPDFDDAVYVESDSAEADLSLALSSSDFRASVLAMLREHASHVVVNGPRARVSVTRTWNLLDLETTDIRRCVNELCRAQAALPAVLAGAAAPSGPDAFQRAALGLVLMAFLGFIALGSVSTEVMAAVARTPWCIGVILSGAIVGLAGLGRAASRSSKGFRRFCLAGIPGLATWLLWSLCVLSWLQ